MVAKRYSQLWMSVLAMWFTFTRLLVYCKLQVSIVYRFMIVPTEVYIQKPLGIYSTPLIRANRFLLHCPVHWRENPTPIYTTFENCQFNTNNNHNSLSLQFTGFGYHFLCKGANRMIKWFKKKSFVFLKVVRLNVIFHLNY